MACGLAMQLLLLLTWSLLCCISWCSTAWLLVRPRLLNQAGRRSLAMGQMLWLCVTVSARVVSRLMGSNSVACSSGCNSGMTRFKP